MRVLLDESVPRRLGGHLAGHLVSTVPQMGWSGIRNGRLLKLAAETFDVLLTVDRNIEHQQAIATIELAIIVMQAHTNDIVDLIPLVPVVLLAIGSATKGSLRVVPP